MRRPNWTPAEDNILREHYAAGTGPSSCLRELPMRTYDSCVQRACLLGLTVKRVLDPNRDTIQARMLAALTARGRATLKQLCAYTGIDSRSLSGAMSNARAAGVIRRVENVSGPGIWELAPARQKAEKWHGIPAGRPYRIQVALEKLAQNAAGKAGASA